MKKSRTAGHRTKGREREKRIGRGGGGRKLVWGRERERERDGKKRNQSRETHRRGRREGRLREEERLSNSKEWDGGVGGIDAGGEERSAARCGAAPRRVVGIVQGRG